MALARRNDACQECCKWRIVCDKAVPQCLKCTKKGIKCSGPGFQCNLSTYMVSPVPQINASLKNYQKRESKRQSPAGHSIRWLKIGQVSKRGYKTKMRRTASSQLAPTISNHLDPQVRMLFSHFSVSVAPIMVVLDSVRNGYRDIILPLACQDEVLSRAVSVISAFHLAQKSQDMLKSAELGYQAIIQRLQRDSMSLQPGHIFNHYTLATILVLLVGETITGVDNYVRLLDMLECFTQSPQNILRLPTELQSFFLEQIRMFQLFGLPLSDETKALQMVCKSPERYLDFMGYPDLSTGSELDRNLQVIREAIIDGCSIYRRRVESSLQEEESIQIIDQLQRNVLLIDVCAGGGHALVWTYFIAAAESILPRHRQFFSDRLKALYSYTGFGSIPASFQSLQKIWDMQKTRRWTQFVTSDAFVLVM